MRIPGAHLVTHDRTRFTVWAPTARSVHVVFPDRPDVAAIALRRSLAGWFATDLDGMGSGTRYQYRLDGGEARPDPASALQPEGVHGASEVVDLAHPWTDATWSGIAPDRLVIYELHVGTFTAEGTFEAIIPRLPELRDLGITALELMPVCAFPGTRNWGYDGTYPFSVHATYGGPKGLQRLVEAAHAAGLAVLLDVVYNHLGPEGNYLGSFGPFFTDRYRTPWGQAVNFDGPDSDQVRQWFIANALRWLEAFHLDGLRLDAVHAIFDFGARHFLAELAEQVRQLERRTARRLHLIAESDQNDSRLLRPPAAGGYGLSAVWADDYHHALHTLLTDERQGYYEDYGSIAHLRRAIEGGFAFAGDHSAHRRRRHGNRADDLPPSQFVICTQNHDQIGNRRDGDRLAATYSLAAQRLAAALLLLSPGIPLLFMGQEFGATTPFPYFVSHGDPQLVEAVREGRRREFPASATGQAPDPQAEGTFQSAILTWEERRGEQGQSLLAWHAFLLHLRGARPALADLSARRVRTGSGPGAKTIWIERWNGTDQVWIFANIGAEPGLLHLPAQAHGASLIAASEPEGWEMAAPNSSLAQCKDAILDTHLQMVIPGHTVRIYANSISEETR
jgi:maltooligosyltrehalose trehalohydrolase